MSRADRRAKHGHSARSLTRLVASPWTPLQERRLTTEELARYPGVARGLVAAYMNNRYSVQVYTRATEWGRVLHLVIRRHDGEMARSWADLQRIKNELVGPERVAIEVFPPESDLMDAANLTHMWVMSEGFSLPFTLHGEW